MISDLTIRSTTVIIMNKTKIFLKICYIITPYMNRVFLILMLIPLFSVHFYIDLLTEESYDFTALNISDKLATNDFVEYHLQLVGSHIPSHVKSINYKELGFAVTYIDTVYVNRQSNSSGSNVNLLTVTFGQNNLTNSFSYTMHYDSNKRTPHLIWFSLTKILDNKINQQTNKNILTNFLPVINFRPMKWQFTHAWLMFCLIGIVVLNINKLKQFSTLTIFPLKGTNIIYAFCSTLIIFNTFMLIANSMILLSLYYIYKDTPIISSFVLLTLVANASIFIGYLLHFSKINIYAILFLIYLLGNNNLWILFNYSDSSNLSKYVKFIFLFNPFAALCLSVMILEETIIPIRHREGSLFAYDFSCDTAIVVLIIYIVVILLFLGIYSLKCAHFKLIKKKFIKRKKPSINLKDFQQTKLRKHVLNIHEESSMSVSAAYTPTRFEVLELTKYFPGTVICKALKNINFTIESNTIFAILGTTSSGKTTLIQLLTGQIEPTTGVLAYFRFGQSAKIQFSYSTHISSTFDNLTILEYIKYCYKTSSIVSISFEEELRLILKFFDLYAVRDSRLKNASLSEKYVVNILSIIFRYEPVLLLDEPFKSLDTKHSILMAVYLKRLKSSRTIIYTTSSFERAECLADRVIFLHLGKVIGIINFTYSKIPCYQGLKIILRVNSHTEDLSLQSYMKLVFPDVVCNDRQGQKFTIDINKPNKKLIDNILLSLENIKEQFGILKIKVNKDGLKFDYSKILMKNHKLLRGNLMNIKSGYRYYLLKSYNKKLSAYRVFYLHFIEILRLSFGVLQLHPLSFSIYYLSCVTTLVFSIIFTKYIVTTIAFTDLFFSNNATCNGMNIIYVGCETNICPRVRSELQRIYKTDKQYEEIFYTVIDFKNYKRNDFINNILLIKHTKPNFNQEAMYGLMFRNDSSQIEIYPTSLSTMMLAYNLAKDILHVKSSIRFNYFSSHIYHTRDFIPRDNWRLIIQIGLMILIAFRSISWRLTAQLEIYTINHQLRLSLVHHSLCFLPSNLLDIFLSFILLCFLILLANMSKDLIAVSMPTMNINLFLILFFFNMSDCAMKLCLRLIFGFDKFAIFLLHSLDLLSLLIESILNEIDLMSMIKSHGLYLENYCFYNIIELRILFICVLPIYTLADCTKLLSRPTQFVLTFFNCHQVNYPLLESVRSIFPMYILLIIFSCQTIFYSLLTYIITHPVLSRYYERHFTISTDLFKESTVESSTDNFHISMKNIFYTDECVSLTNVNWNIPYKSSWLLTGENRNEQTKLLEIMLGKISPRHGSLRINNKLFNFCEITDEIYPIGYCPHENNFLPYLSVYESLLFWGKIRLFETDKLDIIANKLMGDLYMSHYSDHLVKNLTKSCRKKLAIATTFIGMPRIMIFDDPLSDLDELDRDAVIDLLIIAKIHRRTLIISSPDIFDLDNICDNIAVLHRHTILLKNTWKQAMHICLGVYLSVVFISNVGSDYYDVMKHLMDLLENAYNDVFIIKNDGRDIVIFMLCESGCDSKDYVKIHNLIEYSLVKPFISYFNLKVGFCFDLDRSLSKIYK